MLMRLPGHRTHGGELRRYVEEDLRVKGFRVEIIKGKIVMSPTPSFKHGGIVRRIERQVALQLDDARVAHQMFSVAALDDEDDYSTPDLVVVPSAVEDEPGWLLDPDVVELVVEVASPSNAAIDFTDKLESYAQWRIPIYLLIDPRKGDLFVYSDPVEDRYRTTHAARFGESVELPTPLAGVRIDSSGLRTYT
ncbi:MULTISPECIES: Uma2 family endonuclease [Nocardiopsidaceae]|uniref:Uma2 family endonuclease n=1 Tax=Streptomonospora salina TaxID=104205 RepID=A0A841E9W7_9ACTN|nr:MULTISPECIES: Uma2 family endonuclease [Nocardiopsaceae]MBB5999254.1 Uma2 family endonuclease [Streptomonospora salina]